MSHYTTNDGVTLRVMADGPCHAGVTVMLLHGWTQSARTWQWVAHTLPQWAGVPVRTVRYDMRGHGESDPAPAGTATIERCAEDLVELINTLAPSGPVVLAGHSMGGMTIMALAERHPALFADRVRGVALVSTSAGGLGQVTFGLPRPLARLVNGAQHNYDLFTHPYLRPGLRWLLFGQHARRADVAAVADDLVTCDPASIAEYRTSLGRHDRYAALARLRSVPAVVLAGLTDRLTPHPHARRITTALPNARAVVYAGAGHMLPFERREEVTEHIARLVRAAGEGNHEQHTTHRPRNDRAALAEVVGENQL
jgi:pimeloyl-ACP methyl ester carboxylesterase